MFEEIKYYYYPRLGSLWWVYVLGAVGCFFSVVVLAFQEASRLKNKDSKIIFVNAEDPAEHYRTLAILTLVAAGCTALDFALYASHEKIRVTPITIATGAIATFLGVALWSLSNDKTLDENPAMIVILQNVANAVQLAAIFNEPDEKLLTELETDPSYSTIRV